MTDIVEDLRAKAAERRRVGWEISDVMTPAELEEIASEIERLRTALHRAVEWGVASRGHDGGMARKLRDWIDSGMTGDLPEEPDWLRDMRETLDGAR